jgi:hypothetical protein
MYEDEVMGRSAVRALGGAVRGGVEVGQLGLIIAPPGLSGSPLLRQVALAAALRGTPTLHVSLSQGAAQLRCGEDELLAELSRGLRPAERARLLLEVERSRLLHGDAGGGFGPPRLRAVLAALQDAAQFGAQVVVIDAQDVTLTDPEAGEPAAWTAVAAAAGLRLWLAVGATQAGHAETLASGAAAVLRLSPSPSGATLTLARVAGLPPAVGLGWALSPGTLLLAEPPTTAPPLPPSPAAVQCTLYSGGATGAEATFGELAELYGLQEVNFSFEGHNQARAAGRRVLDARALAASDLSLNTVAHRLRRHWEATDTLRKILQSQWHVVANARQLFVVGSIQPDGTVHGGTGWSVELAKRWSKRVWVFDQDHEAWYAWTGAAWRREEPVIESVAFAGTGTRFLNEAGRKAISALFSASFGPVPHEG